MKRAESITQKLRPYIKYEVIFKRKKNCLAILFETYWSQDRIAVTAIESCPFLPAPSTALRVWVWDRHLQFSSAKLLLLFPQGI